jgi:(p)ppGpp synthase/HD superfamily hydrolase
MVEVCTDAETIPKPPWRTRKEAHLAHLREVAPEALLVVAADKLHNARSILADRQAIGEAIWGRFNGGREGTCWYLREMSHLLAERSPGTLAANLAAVVDDLER